ncbi:hypothetical protein Dform_01129 [Dehalogenimonas formicexedens]|uniref:site-specific DNA-methyltransferase (adenine-specific) n=1 Tax=Dehalogenimonas formicexedens TaxID=1839801 RepID=A0A1P8F7P8_9CHLR|nr:type ISP restriction/modification enzyme [Dehalogenimonas formicexedens]APV44463.1 hypothetical protein Dform_01129 [Dehalogenimonas formicexedens]
MPTEIRTILRDYANAVREKLTSGLGGQPEDQLKNPTENLIRAFGELLNHIAIAVTEVNTPEIGRPDMAVAIDSLLVGHIELKQPGIGVNPSVFTGHNLDQWKKFKQLPNLVYSDGNNWALFRSGQRVGEIIHLGDIAARGSLGIRPDAIDAFQSLLTQYLSWQPITPNSPRALAVLLAPLCRFLRDDVLGALLNEDSALSQLRTDWSTTLFPDAGEREFADAYAQTLTYALLLARFDGAGDLRPSRAAETLSHNHQLLGQVLNVLTDPQAYQEIGTAVDVLVRVIGAVAPNLLVEQDPDPWLYFYEDFLAEYDPELREERGVYYTPVQVVQCQTRLVAELLRERFGKPLAYADTDVVLLDPATGTGTYPLAAITEGVECVRERFGAGAVPHRATMLARNIHAFELLVGPYAVAHLRITQKLQESGAVLPDDGIHVYLTDTLESPEPAPSGRLPLSLRPLVDEHRRAGRVKRETRVLVCMGNPPYSRQSFEASEGTDDREARLERLLGDFIRLARGRTMFSHIASLYNSYVYFWRWALWKVFDTTDGPGIVSFITSSSYLKGPGFLGMREVMRKTFDDLWIIDLEGGSSGARRTENVFSIQTPVAIAIGVRNARPNPGSPANVHYVKITGRREDKLTTLDTIHSFADLQWTECSNEWTASFIPEGQSDFFKWPLVTDLFPWQHPGVKVGRTWPISVTNDTGVRRWQRLVSSSLSERSELFADRSFGRGTSTRPSIGLLPPPASTHSIRDLNPNSAAPPIIRYGHRSFDRKWIIADGRLFRTPSQPLWFTQSPKQIYMTSLLTGVLGHGPAAVVSALIPDLHFFRGSFGGKDVIPLWRDPSGTEPNITHGFIQYLERIYGTHIQPEDIFAYTYSILANSDFTQHFAEDLATSAARIPITTDVTLFRNGVDLGRRLIWLHTYGERLVPIGERIHRVPSGRARALRPISSTPDGYPNDFHWDEATETLHVGDGTFAPVTREVWEYEVSGLRPVRSWLGYRKREPSGRTSSPLDEIHPLEWPAEFNEELLELLWVLEQTVNMSPSLSAFLDAVLQSEIIQATELPFPTEEERRPPDSRGNDREPTEQSSF